MRSPSERQRHRTAWPPCEVPGEPRINWFDRFLILIAVALLWGALALSISTAKPYEPRVLTPGEIAHAND